MVVERVAEDDIGMGTSDAAECRCLRRACGNVDEIAGDDAIDHFHFGGEDAFFGNAKTADVFVKQPTYWWN